MRIALRPDQQATKRYPVQVPALSGVWDTFPLLHSGAAGFVVSGDQVTVSDPFALRALVANGPHGGMKDLDEQKVNDLLAFLLML